MRQLEQQHEKQQPPELDPSPAPGSSSPEEPDVCQLEQQRGPQQPPELDPSPAAPSREEPADVSELEQQQQQPTDLHPSPAPKPE
jgi:hypothetical protein